MLLVAPIVGALVAVRQFGIAFVIGIFAVGFSSLPDVDIYLTETVNADEGWLPAWLGSPLLIVVGFAFRLHNLGARILPRLTPIDRQTHTLQHRGITHTVWFGLAIAILLLSVSVGLVGILIALNAYTTASIPIVAGGGKIGAIGGILLYGLAITVGAILGVLYHSLGDIVTPSGVGLVDPREAQSLDRFNFDNVLANTISKWFGAVTLPVAVLSGYGVAAGPLKVRHFLIILGSIYLVFLPIWMWLPQTRVGRWITKFYEFLS